MEKRAKYYMALGISEFNQNNGVELTNQETVDSGLNPFTSHPEEGYYGGEVFRAGANQMYDAFDSPEEQSDGESSLSLWPMGSEPETEVMPTPQRLLGALLILRPYQTDPNDPACQARIDRLREEISRREREENAIEVEDPEDTGEQSALHVE